MAEGNPELDEVLGGHLEALALIPADQQALFPGFDGPLLELGFSFGHALLQQESKVVGGLAMLGGEGQCLFIGFGGLGQTPLDFQGDTLGVPDIRVSGARVMASRTIRHWSSLRCRCL